MQPPPQRPTNHDRPRRRPAAHEPRRQRACCKSCVNSHRVILHSGYLFSAGSTVATSAEASRVSHATTPATTARTMTDPAPTACTSGCRLRRGKVERARLRTGAERMAPGNARRLLQHRERIAHVADQGVRHHRIERGVGERQATHVAALERAWLSCKSCVNSHRAKVRSGQGTCSGGFLPRAAAPGVRTGSGSRLAAGAAAPAA